MDITYISQNLLKLIQNFDKQKDLKKHLAVHAKGEIAKDYILTKHLTEDDYCYDWRIKNFTPITRSIWNRASSALQRILTDSKFRMEASDSLEQYLQTASYKGMRFDNYIFQSAVPAMLEDPNGLLVWVPLANKIGDTGSFLEPVPVIVNCDKLKIVSAELVVFESDELEKLYAEKFGKPEGTVWWAFTRNQILRFNNLYATSGTAYYTEIYTHNIGEIPATYLGGYWDCNNYYRSFFDSFLEIADECLRIFSDWQVVVSTSCFPTKIVKPIQCSAMGCTRESPKGENGEVCARCAGSGLLAPTSPFHTIVREETPFGKDVDNRPDLEYISPPVANAEYLQTAYESLFRKAEDALNLYRVDASQSGIAKEIDREELTGFLGPIVNNVYDNLMQKSLNFIEKYREVVRPTLPKVFKPTSFRIKLATELETELREQMAANQPQMVVRQTFFELVDKRYNGSAAKNKEARFICYYDPLFGKNPDLKIVGLASEAYTLEQVQWSEALPNLIYQYIEDVGEKTFLQQEYEVIYKIIKEKFNNQIISNSNGQNDRTGSETGYDQTGNA